MASISISTLFFDRIWPQYPTLVRLDTDATERRYEHIAYWDGEGLEFCSSVLGYLPEVVYEVRLSKERDGSGISAWTECVVATFGTDADLVAFRLRFPEV